MSPDSFEPDSTGVPPFVKPLLHALDRMQERETLRPDQMTERARALLQERFGRSSQNTEAAFAHGAVGLLGGHTHYFDGFAVLMPLPQGTAVAVREAETTTSRVTFEGSDDVWTFDLNAGGADGRSRTLPVWVCIVEELVRRLASQGDAVEIAVVSMIQAGCVDAYLSALGVATGRAVQALFALPLDTAPLLRQINQALTTCSELPFSIAYSIVAEAGRPQTFTLVDTATLEHLAIEAPSHDVLGWGLVDVQTSTLNDVTLHQKRKRQADEALKQLQKRGFEQIDSLRELEHRDLERALKAVSRRLCPVVRHLVTENRRVQKLVAAARRRDWQMFGALLLMSHASARDDWRFTNEKVDFVVMEAEKMCAEGMYGACVTGRGSCALVVGQPFIVPMYFDRMQAAFVERFETTPDVLLL